MPPQNNPAPPGRSYASRTLDYMTSTNALYLAYLVIVVCPHLGPVEHPEQDEYHGGRHGQGHPDTTFERRKHVPQRYLQHVKGGC